MFTDSLFEKARCFTDIAEPTWTYNNVNNMGGVTRNDVIYLGSFPCMWVGEIFTRYHVVALCASSAFIATMWKRA